MRVPRAGDEVDPSGARGDLAGDVPRSLHASVGTPAGPGPGDGESGGSIWRRAVGLPSRPGRRACLPATKVAQGQVVDGGDVAAGPGVCRHGQGLVTSARGCQDEAGAPSDGAMHVSHETIYTWFYLLPKGELKRSLLAGLRQGKEHRGLERRGHYGRPRIATW
jgi:hypothetical protein